MPRATALANRGLLESTAKFIATDEVAHAADRCADILGELIVAYGKQQEREVAEFLHPDEPGPPAVLGQGAQ